MTLRFDSPAFARAIASWRLPADAREFVLGDLEEGFQEIADEKSMRAARRWYWRQSIRCVFTRYPRRSSVAPLPKGSPMHIVNDARFAIRWLRRSPGFTATALLTLALGIGATTAMFSVVHAVLFAPLPFAHPDRLVLARGGPTVAESRPISFQYYREWRDSGVFDDTAAFFGWNATLTDAGDAVQLRGSRASASLFSVLGVHPALGQPFTREDEGVGGDRKVLLGHDVWRARFNAANDIVGQRIKLNDLMYTVVGVLPADFRLRPTDPPPEILAPLRLTDETAPPSLFFMTAVARLKAGQSPAHAREALEAVIRPLHPEAQPPVSATIVPLHDLVAGDSRSALLALLAATGVLLLIACTNLAHLFLSRAAARRQEMAVRLAIGAGRRRLIAQLLTESLVLSLIGGALGVGLAILAVKAAGSSSVLRATGAYSVAVNIPVLLFAIATAIVAGLLFGIAPALGAGRQSTRADMAEESRSATARSVGRSALVVAEVALTLVLLAGAGLLTRSLGKLLSADKGFDPSHVLSFSLSTPGAKFRAPEARTRFFRDAIEQVSALPTVTAVGFITDLPLAGGGVDGGVPIEGRTFPPDKQPSAEKRVVAPGYFRAMGIRTISGRTFDETDTSSSPGVMVVSEKFAKTYFPNESPIGKRASFNWDMYGAQDIVGVVADVRHYGLDEPPNAMVYVSYLQRPIDGAAFVVKTTGDPAALAGPVRDVVRRIDKDRPLMSVNPMETFVAQSVETRRFSLTLVGAFALLGLALAAIGIYGVVSYAARQRQREFGIRLALGATSREITAMVLRRGVWPAVIGLAIGVVAALAATRAIRTQLFGVEPTDPITFIGSAALLLVVAALACYLPARSARRVDVAALFRWS